VKKITSKVSDHGHGGEEVAGSSQAVAATTENATDAISLLNAEGQIVYASASTSEVLGYQPEELVGRNGLDLFHPQDREHSLRALKKVLAEPQFARRVQARVRQKDGQWRWVESTASNLLHEPRVGAVVLTYRQVAASRGEEEETEHVVEELTRSNADLEAFARTAAHDLREPLRTIGSFTEILVRRAKLGEADKEIADFIIDGVRRMSALVDGLLKSAVLGVAEAVRPVPLGHVAAQAIQNLREALTSTSATVTVGPLPTVYGDECDLIRVFQNLISNAAKYRSEAPVVVHISAERSGPDWVIRVRDNGIGVAKENHHRVFGRFTRLHSDAITGTGLGLAVCKRIVEGVGGAIWVESSPGVGSTFCFTIAAAQEQRRS
jgi:PAS domain S-box-containing protein